MSPAWSHRLPVAQAVHRPRYRGWGGLGREVVGQARFVPTVGTKTMRSSFRSPRTARPDLSASRRHRR
jgi:hypothetical protein